MCFIGADADRHADADADRKRGDEDSLLSSSF
jgi:hypothetical protein